MTDPSSNRPGRPRDPDVDRRIAQAARAILIEGGMDALTVAATAKRAGVGRPTVYRRYRDASQLAAVVLHSDIEEMMQGTRARIPELGEPLDVMMAEIRAYYEYFARHPKLSLAMIRLAMPAQGEWGLRLSAQTTELFMHMQAFLDRCKAAGRLHPEVDTLLASQAFFAFYYMHLIGLLSDQSPGIEMLLLNVRALLAAHLRIDTGVAPPDLSPQ